MVDFCDDALGAFSLLDRAPLGSSGQETRAVWGPCATKLSPGDVPVQRHKPAKKKVRNKVEKIAPDAAPRGGQISDSPDVELLPPESETGNVEYKLKLVNIPPSRFQHLVSQLLFRLSEGAGEAVYKIGVTDGGFPQGLSDAELQASIWTVRQMAEQLRCTCASVGVRPGVSGRWAEVRVVHVIAHALACPSVRVAVAGATGAGKSTLIAVLTRGGGGDPLLDDGRGAARMAVVRHKHEIQTGRTSSRSLHHIGYTNEGLPLNYSAVAALDAAAATALGGPGDGHLASIVSFVELCGHEKYAKTALFGLTCLRPHILCLVVSPPEAAGGGSLDPPLPADDPLTPTGRQHLAAALALRVPAFAVVAKADAASSLPAVRAALAAVAGRPGDVDAAAPVVATREHARRVAARIASDLASSAPPSDERPSFGRFFPVFPVSCVTGQGLPQLHSFLAALPQSRPRGGAGGGAPRCASQGLDEPAPAAAPARGLGAPGAEEGGDAGPAASAAAPECAGGADPAAAAALPPPILLVEQVLEPQAAGRRFVAAGVLSQGRVVVGDDLVLGPLGPARSFASVRVVSIRCAHVPVRCLRAGQAATLQLELPGAGWPDEAAPSQASPAAHGAGAAWSAPDLTAAADRPRRSRGGSAGRGRERPGPPEAPPQRFRNDAEEEGLGADSPDPPLLLLGRGPGRGGPAGRPPRGSADGSLASPADFPPSSAPPPGEFRVVSSCAEMTLGSRLGAVGAARRATAARHSASALARLLVGESGGSGSEAEGAAAGPPGGAPAQRAPRAPPPPPPQQTRERGGPGLGGGKDAAGGAAGAGRPRTGPGSPPDDFDIDDVWEDVTTVLLEDADPSFARAAAPAGADSPPPGRGAQRAPPQAPPRERWAPADDACSDDDRPSASGRGEPRRLGRGAAHAPGRPHPPARAEGPQAAASAAAVSPAAAVSGGRKKQQKGLILAHPAVVADCPPCWEFDAALVVLSGKAAALGACLAPAAAEPPPPAACAGEAAPPLAPGDKKGEMLVCCGSVRQAAKMIGWSSVPSALDSSSAAVRQGAAAASAVVSLGGGDAADEMGPKASAPLPAMLVRLRFAHRPEWIAAGASFLVADLSSGRLIASGYVTAPVSG